MLHCYVSIFSASLFSVYLLHLIYQSVSSLGCRLLLLPVMCLFAYLLKSPVLAASASVAPLLTLLLPPDLPPDSSYMF